MTTGNAIYVIQTILLALGLLVTWKCRHDQRLESRRLDRHHFPNPRIQRKRR